MQVKLLAIPASHPCAAVAAMLDAKGVEYERIDLVPALSRVWLRLTGFPAGTVPALRLDGIRVQGSRAIARALDERVPAPPLLPADPAARRLAEEIEAWGDGPLQAAARRIVLWALGRRRDGARGALEGARLQFRIPVGLAARVSGPVLRLDAALNGVSDAAVRSDLAALPSMIDRIDGWIATGALGGEPPSAADFQVAASVRMLLTLDDLAPILCDRPAEVLARRIVPRFPGGLPAGVVPLSWLP